MYCKFCGSHLDDNSTVCSRCGSDIDPNDGGQSFYDDEELNEWRGSSGLSEIKTIMPTAEIAQNEDFDDEIDESVRKEPTTILLSGRNFKSENKASEKRLDIFVIAGLSGLIIILLIALAAFILMKDGSGESSEEEASEIISTETLSETKEEDTEENKEDENGKGKTEKREQGSEDMSGKIAEIPNDKDIAEICSVTDKEVYVNGEELELVNKSSDSLNVYTYEADSYDIIYIPYDRLMLALGFELSDDSNTLDGSPVVFERSDESALSIGGNEVSEVSVEIGKYEVKIEYSDSENKPETATISYPVLNCDDDENGKNIHETYVPAEEFAKALGMKYSEQDNKIYIGEEEAGNGRKER